MGYLYYMYLVKTPWWLRAIYPSLVWKLPAREKVIYLSFDDGPHETATPFALDMLKSYDAKASFFCIGKNVRKHPEIYQRILNEGHAVGNHTEHHANGWKNSNAAYFMEIQQASEVIASNLFRPPYGRIRRSQIRNMPEIPSNQLLPERMNGRYKIIMWDVLSGDFDPQLGPEACCSNVIRHTEPGSIVVFHDSTKAWDRMSYALPRVLEYFTERGYRFEAIGSI